MSGKSKLESLLPEIRDIPDKLIRNFSDGLVFSDKVDCESDCKSLSQLLVSESSNKLLVSGTFSIFVDC